MVKSTSFIFLIVIVFISGSCTTRIKMQNDCLDSFTYKIIDTSTIYIMTKINSSFYTKNSKNETVKVTSLNKAIKFYSNGKVGLIRFYSLQDLEKIDYKNSEFGDYCINEKNMIIRYKSYNVQSGKYTVKAHLDIKDDLITVHVERSASTKGLSISYINIKHKNSLD